MELAAEISPRSAVEPSATVSESTRFLEGVSRKTIAAAVTLAALQILDGILTLIGVSRGGPVVEGNPLLRELMVNFGYTDTIFVLKSTAIGVILLLTAASRRSPWITNALIAVSVAYFFGAILPWCYVLFFFFP